MNVTQKRKNKLIVSVSMFALGAMSMFVIMDSRTSVRTPIKTMRQAEIAYMSQKGESMLEREIKKKVKENKLVVKTTYMPAKKVRILCFVKTQPKTHISRALVVKYTWGKRCDKLLFMSSKVDKTLPSIGLFPNNYTESRNLLTEKVFRALKYIYTNYLNDYDWFHEADDDTYIIVDNLRGFLSTKNPNDPVYFGHRFMKYVPQGYTSGGAGYVMSREALRRIRDIGPKERLCNTKGTASDAHIGHCLNAVGVKLGISVDSKGRSRYHCMELEAFIFGGFPGWYKNFTAKSVGGAGFKENWIADYPISFHYVSPEKMYTLDLLLHQTKVHGESRKPRPSLN